jgi:alpha-N-acetylglucosaminidase
MTVPSSTGLRILGPRALFLGLGIVGAAFGTCGVGRATPAESAARGLIQRVVASHAAEIAVEQIPAGAGGADVFEVESLGGRLILRGNTGVSIASALGWYLTHVAHAQMSWDGDNLGLPGSLPVVPAKVRITSPYRYRAYLNYCTFNYTMSWWDRHPDGSGR